MLKVLQILGLLLFSQFSISQIITTDKERIELSNLEIERDAKNDTTKVIVSIFNIDANNSPKKNIYLCLPAYNSNLLKITTIDYIGISSKLYITRESDKMVEEKPWSTLYLFTANLRLQNALKNNLSNLALEEFYDNKHGVISFKIVEIRNQEDFCWKLNQIIHFFESNKELFTKEEKPAEEKKDKPKFSVNLGFSILNPQKIATSQGFYNNQLSAAAMPLSYAADFQYWINNFRVGLGYAYSNYQFNNSLADNNYSIDWKSDKLNNASQMNIYASNLRESFSFEQHNLNLLAGYSIPFNLGNSAKNKLRLDIDLGLGYVLPFTLRSRLTDATISYRGLVNGIEDELMNIAELGLIENDRTAIGKETALRMQGISLHTGLNLVYAYNNFNFKLGMGYHLNRYRNKSYNENQRLSFFSGDYQSSLYSNKQLNTQFNSFQFSIGYTIK